MTCKNVSLFRRLMKVITDSVTTVVSSPLNMTETIRRGEEAYHVAELNISHTVTDGDKVNLEVVR